MGRSSAWLADALSFADALVWKALSSGLRLVSSRSISAHDLPPPSREPRAAQPSEDTRLTHGLSGDFAACVSSAVAGEKQWVGKRMLSAGEQGHATWMCHPAAVGAGGIAHPGDITPVCHECCQDLDFVHVCILSRPGGMLRVALGKRHRYFSRNVPTSPNQGIRGEVLGHLGDSACPRSGDEAAPWL